MAPGRWHARLSPSRASLGAAGVQPSPVFKPRPGPLAGPHRDRGAEAARRRRLRARLPRSPARSWSPLRPPPRQCRRRPRWGLCTRELRCPVWRTLLLGFPIVRNAVSAREKVKVGLPAPFCGWVVGFVRPSRPSATSCPIFAALDFLDRTVLGDSWGAAQSGPAGPSNIYAKPPYSATLTWGGKEEGVRGSRPVLALGASLTFGKLRKPTQTIKTKPL